MLIKRYLIPLILIAKQRLIFFFSDKKFEQPAFVYNLFSLALGVCACNEDFSFRYVWMV